MRSKAHTAPTAPLIKLSGRDVICSAFGKWKGVYIFERFLCYWIWLCFVIKPDIVRRCLKIQLVACMFESRLSYSSTIRSTASYTTRGTSLVVDYSISIILSVQIGLGDFVPGTNFKGRDGEMNKIKLIINFVYLLGNNCEEILSVFSHNSMDSRRL
jgi:hypothetical protein